MEWTSSLDIAAKQLNPAQLQCLPNLRWSKSTQTFITAQAKSGRRCLALAQAAMEMVAVEKASLLDRMRRDEAFRTRAKDGKTAMRAMDRAIIFHVSYEKETGRDRAYSAVDFGLATLVETCKIVQEQLQPIFEARQTGMEFARPFQVRFIIRLDGSFQLFVPDFALFCERKDFPPQHAPECVLAVYNSHRHRGGCIGFHW